MKNNNQSEIDALKQEIEDKNTQILLLKAQNNCTNIILDKAWKLLEQHKVELNKVIDMLTPGTPANIEYMKIKLEEVQKEILSQLNKKS